MTPDLGSAIYKGEYRIELTFGDGSSGVVDFSEYPDRGGVFENFRDIQFFSRFRVNEELGTLTWENELDIAPETLYSKAAGFPFPDWAENGEPSANTSIQRPG